MMGVLRLSPSPGSVDGVVAVPRSKSIANRMLIAAFLAEGRSVIHGVPPGDDCGHLVTVLQASQSAFHIDDDSWAVEGGRADRLPPLIDCGLAGTTSRFLTAVAALSGRSHVVDGGLPLRHRPMGDLHRALRSLGAQIEYLGVPDHLPVRVGGAPISGGVLKISGEVSSQFLSSLLLIGPLLKGGLDVEVEGALVSSSYVEMTCSVMASFGVNVARDDEVQRWVVPEGGYRGRDVAVEADYSSAAFPIAAVLVRGGRVHIPDLKRGSDQGDERMLDLAVQMGATVVSDNGIIVTRDALRPLRPIDVDLSDCSDLVPAITVACLAAQGESRIRGVGFIRAKESNRIEDLASELVKRGAHVEPTADGLKIRGGGHLTPGLCSTHDDHRLAMAFSVLSLLCPGITVGNPEVMTKSWPSFVTDMCPLLGTPE